MNLRRAGDDRFGLRAAWIVAGAVGCLAFLFADLPPLYHSDVWAHAAVGRWIVGGMGGHSSIRVGSA